MRDPFAIEKCKEIIQEQMEEGKTQKAILSNLLDETDYFLQTYRVRLGNTLSKDDANNPTYLRRLTYYEEMRRAILHLQSDDREPP